jgi:SEC-C motif-containing protein
MNENQRCPCQSGLWYSECCEAVLSGRKQAGTAEALMRSRYSAYVVGDTAYVLRTWHASTRPSTLETDTIPAWCGLEIIRTEKGQEEDDEGLVEFRARALSQQNLVELHEESRFVKEDGQWLYVSGDIREETPPKARATDKVGRNSPCPCGSGKKYKKCCGS